MDAAQRAWEGVAADVGDETGCDEPPVDALELADCCRHEVRYQRHAGARRIDAPPGSGLLGFIYVNARASGPRLHGLVAHELGHWALLRAGEENVERGARYLAGALLLPRRAFERDLRETKWDLPQLRAKHINASAELIARRIVNLRDAVVSIWDGGRLTQRIWSPWLAERFWGRRPSRIEAELAAAALESGQVQREHDLLAAWPIFDGDWRRVIVLAEAEQLSLRL